MVTDIVVYFDNAFPSAVYPARVVVELGEYDNWTFATTTECTPQMAYRRAMRFLRLLDRGYAPERAYGILDFNYSSGAFEYWFDEALHAPNIPVALIPETCVSSEDVMFVDPLTIEEKQRCYDLWLQGGDSIFAFTSPYFDDCDIPGMLREFRDRAQREDDPMGDWSHPHHSDLVSY